MSLPLLTAPLMLSEAGKTIQEAFLYAYAYPTIPRDRPMSSPKTTDISSWIKTSAFAEFSKPSPSHEELQRKRYYAGHHYLSHKDDTVQQAWIKRGVT
ncbi:hypothetical protein P7K49_011171 [Saguinus oedipus]|uniref:Testis expressed 26 n=1 Tax=Saguinus oedipus TaxID=9490 RepID=A0ABQ9VPW5_SAGOE|nr:hypothetical protein P7K49_011171 [Saguinus oedipus]